MVNFIADEQVEGALDYLRDNATQAAKAKAERVYIEEYRKSLKAMIMLEHSELPLGAQERNAYADPRYIAHLEALKAAVEVDERQKHLRTAAEAKIEAWRSQSANERAMKL